MKTKSIFIFAAIMVLFSCDSDTEIDKEKPVIHTDFINAFPSYCDTIYFGETFNLRALFSDNEELGAYSIDIHNNFDHHSHGFNIEECELGPKKEPVNPFVFLEDYEIPAGQNEYEVYLPMTISSENGEGLFDEGDYHFQINLTDKEGWSTPLGLSIKMLYRKK
ncbi:DUF4625 domain-containing protein [Carboxylicivirga sp. RSCT41]|uniref:DUF4625 domain-containing protein n=1 Tax=Carboxylicivirga agarovorans TaxID=3417570 RepID=UPI003D336F17